jgi:potassium-transporting ATPase potassium-binding subunit
MSSFLLMVIVLGGSVLLSWPLGKYMNRVLDPQEGQPSKWDRIFTKLIGSGITQPQGWKAYCVSMLVFNMVMFGTSYLFLAIQSSLPLNPDGKGPLESSLIFNSVCSFVTNTNLQHYSGEQHLSYFSQLFFVAWMQFVSAATGIAAFLALARGLAGRTHMGNFFQDVYRITFYLLLPLAAAVAILLILCGMPMTFKGAAVAQTLEGAIQTIARGPAAAIVAIKQLGTNGGGFFGPNSTHPYENPNFISNIIECISILIIPMACVWLFGWITRRMRHAAIIFGVMGVFTIIKVLLALHFEALPNPAFAGLPVSQTVGNLEGKELRFGAGAGPLWAVMTTVTSNGSVNCMHDSLNAMTGLMPMIGMWLNCVFGGVGVGFINMFMYIIIAVFIAGLMVGRTPEYLTRKVEAREMKLASIAILSHPLSILIPTAIFAATAWGAATVNNPGSHGFSEILYEFTSASANNGSGFEGLGDNTVPWNIATGVVMLMMRFIPIITPLALAGSLAAKRPTPETVGTFRTDTYLFGGVLLGTIILVGALLFMPVAVLGPIAEHLSIH